METSKLHNCLENWKAVGENNARCEVCGEIKHLAEALSYLVKRVSDLEDTVVCLIGEKNSAEAMPIPQDQPFLPQPTNYSTAYQINQLTQSSNDLYRIALEHYREAEAQSQSIRHNIALGSILANNV